MPPWCGGRGRNTPAYPILRFRSETLLNPLDDLINRFACGTKSDCTIKRVGFECDKSGIVCLPLEGDAHRGRIPWREQLRRRPYYNVSGELTLLLDLPVLPPQKQDTFESRGGAGSALAIMTRASDLGPAAYRPHH